MEEPRFRGVVLGLSTTSVFTMTAVVYS